MKVTSYIRTSGHSADIKRQRMQCKEYCTKNGYELVKELDDKGISGVTTSTERKSLAELMTLTKEDTDIIFLSELSRFSRQDSMISVANDLKAITDKGISVYIFNIDKTIVQDFDKDFMTTLEVILQSKHASEEREKTRMRMMSGKRAKITAGAKFMGSKILFGY